MKKTNVIRILDKNKIKYEEFVVDKSLVIDGITNCKLINSNPKYTLKTLVTIGKSGEHYVFVIPVDKNLDLKKAASAVGEKNIEMIHAKELLPLTGYIHLGCSPIGMKKTFQTIIDENVKKEEYIVISGGEIGISIKLRREDLEKVISIKYAAIAI